MNDFNRIALLIDADNAQAAKAESILKEVSAYGRIVIKRAYGNWSKPQLAPWEKEIKRFAISAIQQFDFAAGKNASDMALTIDAMELLYTGKYDCFVIVSSDSDFTSLAIKLHEEGVYVVGYGRRATVESFRNACDEFNYIEDLEETVPVKKRSKKQQKKGSDQRKTEQDKAAQEAAKAAADAKAAQEAAAQAAQEAAAQAAQEAAAQAAREAQEAAESEPTDPAQDLFAAEDELDELLRVAAEKYADDSGYAPASLAGNYIKRVKPDFNIKRLGYKKLYDYLKSDPDMYMVIETASEGNSGVRMIKYKVI